MIQLSIILNSYNMQRELPRTLHTLTAEYQNVPASSYELILIDNGSSEPFDPTNWEQYFPHFHYHYAHDAKKSPASIINRMARYAKGRWLMVCIDGARMLSPGILGNTLKIIGEYKKPFVYTMGLHLGPRQQQLSVCDGYDQQAEDILLNSVDWQRDGYQLFSVSSVAGSSRDGYLSTFLESNCFTVHREHWQELGGYDERFTSAGGGLMNLDLCRRVHQDLGVQPVLLLGEATFHQYHGGIASNNVDRETIWQQMEQEYYEIRDAKFNSAWRPALWYGRLGESARRFLDGAAGR